MKKKIAVLRANALGDFIFILPALRALKKTFTDSEIVLLGKEWHKEFLNGRPGPVDRVIVVPPYPGVSEPEEFVADLGQLEEFFSEMRREKFDMAFQLHGGGRNSNPFVLRLGAAQTIGLRTPDAVSLDVNVPYVYYFSEILRYLEVVTKAGANIDSLKPQLTVTRADLQEAQAQLKNLDRKPLAIVHPGASDLRRRWPAENFAAVADFLVDKGYLVCITGTASEKPVVGAVLEHVLHPEQVHDFSDRLSVNGLTGLVRLADLVVSNDTGPLHLARALDVASVGIFWCGNSITGLSTTSDIHRSLISWSINCPLCGLSSKAFDAGEQHSCDHQTSFVGDVTLPEVEACILEILQQLKETQGSQIEKERAA